MGRRKTPIHCKLKQFLRETVNHSFLQSVLDSLPQAHLKCYRKLLTGKIVTDYQKYQFRTDSLQNTLG